MPMASASLTPSFTLTVILEALAQVQRELGSERLPGQPEPHADARWSGLMRERLQGWVLRGEAGPCTPPAMGKRATIRQLGKK